MTMRKRKRKRRQLSPRELLWRMEQLVSRIERVEHSQWLMVFALCGKTQKAIEREYSTLQNDLAQTWKDAGIDLAGR